MEDLEILLSDQFAEFSQKVKEIAESRKKQKAEFKAVYEEFQAAMRNFDEAVLKLQKDFETWKHDRQTAVVDS